MHAERAAVLELAAQGALEAHPFANMFPMLPDDEAAELAVSIGKVGLLEPIVILSRQILDGRNRFLALAAAGVALEAHHVVIFEGDEKEALAYVNAKNINRRHLTTGQRAMLAADIANVQLGEGGGRNNAPRLVGKVTMEQAAQKFNVNKREVARARYVERDAPKHVSKMVRDGELSIQVADDARRFLKREKLARLKTPEAIEKALEGTRKTRVMTLPTANLLHNIEQSIEELARRGAAKVLELDGAQVRIDTALQQMTVLAASLAEAAREATEDQGAAA